jgi:hypothetical protein
MCIALRPIVDASRTKTGVDLPREFLANNLVR